MRFAPIIRVSTEKQEKKGESLKTQTAQIKNAVEMMKGTIPDHCWQYSGQEHATAEFEREKLDQLLEDASKDLFDAVIVVDPTRWSRDNKRNEEGLDILRDNRIKFFVGTMPHSLYDPNQTFIIAQAVGIGKYMADLGSYKSITTRIRKAREGRPAATVPHGRTWDEKKGWGVDPEAKEIINDVAKRFLAGECLTHLGKIYGRSRNYLRYLLKERCGDTWIQKFKAKKFDIDEVIETPVPPLIDDPNIIEAVKARLEANKTTLRGALRKSVKGNRTYQKYLFSKMILCGHCGSGLSGEFSNYRIRHYKHKPYDVKMGVQTPCSCRHFRVVQCDLIEQPIMKHILKTFGDPVAAEKAIKDAIPDLSEVAGLEKGLIRFEKDRDELNRKIESWMNQIEDEEDEDGLYRLIMNRVKKYFVRVEAIEAEIKSIKRKLESIPNRQKIEHQASIMKRMIKGYHKTPPKKYYEKLTFEEKRELLQHLFIGKDADGNRLGIYIKKYEKGWKYEIRGILISDYGSLSDDALLLDTKKTTNVDRPT